MALSFIWLQYAQEPERTSIILVKTLLFWSDSFIAFFPSFNIFLVKLYTEEIHIDFGNI